MCPSCQAGMNEIILNDAHPVARDPELRRIGTGRLYLKEEEGGKMFMLTDEKRRREIEEG